MPYIPYMGLYGDIGYIPYMGISLYIPYMGISLYIRCTGLYPGYIPLYTAIPRIWAIPCI